MKIIPFFIPEVKCSGKCIYCNQQIITGEKKHSENDIPNLLREFLDNVKTPESDFEFAFFGGTFTAISKEIMRKLLEIIEIEFPQKRFKGIRFSTHPNSINQEIIETLSDFKISTIELGIQSFDKKVLKALGRSDDINRMIHAIKLIKDKGYKLGIQLMTCTPKETIWTHILNLKKLRALRPDYLRIYPLVVIKGTTLYRMYLDGDFISPSLEDSIKTTYLYIKKCREWGIKIIRMGLKNEPSLKKNIVVGPYHESYGELCWSYFFYRHIVKNLRKSKSGFFYINPVDISKFLGYKRKNIKKISNLYGFELEYKITNNISSGEILFQADINSGKDGN